MSNSIEHEIARALAEKNYIALHRDTHMRTPAWNRLDPKDQNFFTEFARLAFQAGRQHSYEELIAHDGQPRDNT